MRIDRKKLEDLAGPLLVEEPTTTTLVLPGQSLTVTDRGIMVLSEGAA